MHLECSLLNLLEPKLNFTTGLYDTVCLLFGSACSSYNLLRSPLAGEYAQCLWNAVLFCVTYLTLY